MSAGFDDFIEGGNGSGSGALALPVQGFEAGETGVYGHNETEDVRIEVLLCPRGVRMGIRKYARWRDALFVCYGES